MTQDSNNVGEFKTLSNDYNPDSIQLIRDGLEKVFQNKREAGGELEINPISAKILSFGINLEKVRNNYLLEANKDAR